MTGRKLLVHLALGIAALLPVLSCDDDSPSKPFQMLPASAGNPPHAAVLLVPGCSGFTEVNGVNLYDERADELQAAGYAVVLVDYIGRRNLTDCGRISKAEVAKDIQDAAKWVGNQADIDGKRISVIGWSYGGGGVLAAMATGQPTFAKAVLYYPDCRGAAPLPATGASAVMFLGAIDDVARPALCEDVIKGTPPDRLRAIVYPGAHHGFDVRTLPQPRQYPFGTLGYNPEAARESWSTTLQFLK